MKRIWFTQQKPFGYMPLRAGLRLCTLEELRERGIFYGSEAKEAILRTHQRTCKSLTDIGYNPEMLCPKLYTTRTHRLSGEYYVVEGSRFKAKPVEPRIEFVVSNTWELNLSSGNILGLTNKIPSVPMPLEKFMDWDYPEFTIPELDLGFRGASFKMLRAELLHLNKKATIETPFFINKLEPILREKPISASYIAHREAQIGALP